MAWETFDNGDERDSHRWTCPRCGLTMTLYDDGDISECPQCVGNDEVQ